MSLPNSAEYTDEARIVLSAAVALATEWGHASVGTEHILLAIIQQEGAPARLLAQKRLAYEDGRSAMYMIRGKGDRLQHASEIGPRAARCLKLAADEAKSLGDARIGPEHLLLGILGQPNAPAIGMLASYGIDPDVLREQVLAAMRRDG